MTVLGCMSTLLVIIIIIIIIIITIIIYRNNFGLNNFLLLFNV